MTKLTSFDATGFQYAVDATTITAFQTCPRKYQWRNLLGWTRRLPAVHLRFGGHYASALEAYHKARALGADHDEALREVVATAMLETWDHDLDEEGNRIPGTGAEWNSLHNTKTRETLIRSIVWYLTEYEHDNMSTLILSDGSAGVEYSFALPMEDDIVYCGHIDRMVDFDGPYVQDQKTTGTTVTPRFFEAFSPDNQMSGYSWAGQIIFNIPIKGVVIDAAQIAVGFTKFTRGFVHRSAATLSEWFDNTMKTTEEMRKAHKDNSYRMNTTACGNYGGCEFRGICARIPSHHERALRADFERKEAWDPIVRR